ncbi:hypothetical protein F2P81_000518 [Scophthalmus maximus]|uniref:Uncharacterized protein n=1 Tax=Scophthalmus maximus TaxID=52904 RepID=A0A6A4TNN4_SCOMX|nr:hypothetical protein F2P81_000518 [Scophthalmus maximus]
MRLTLRASGDLDIISCPSSKRHQTRCCIQNQITEPGPKCGVCECSLHCILQEDKEHLNRSCAAAAIPPNNTAWPWLTQLLRVHLKLRERLDECESDLLAIYPTVCIALKDLCPDDSLSSIHTDGAYAGPRSAKIGDGNS